MALRSALYEEHRRLGAKLTEFGGWDMPLTFRGVIAEHLAVRERVGLFDVSHLGKVIVEGEGAVETLDTLLPGKVASLDEWTAGYNLVLNEDAGIVDDIFVYRRPEGFVVVPNAANSEAVLEVLRSGRRGGAEVIDARERWAILALSGPKARELVAGILPQASGLGLHSCADLDLNGVPVQVARTGYTGEFTLEFFVPSQRAPAIWRLLLEAGEPQGILPAGLGARDTLRLEMGYPLHGHEISPETNPLEAALGWLIQWDKPAFRGKERLEQIRTAGTARRLVGLVAHGREIPRAGYPIVHEGRQVGDVTSGNFSPVLGKGIALGYVPPGLAAAGTMLSVDVRGRALPMEVTKPPFVGS